jgi:HEXXH motif-containing protein
VSPAVFARYYELVEAIASDRLEDARLLFDQLACAKPMPKGLQVITLGEPETGGESERYSRLMNSDKSIDLGFLPPAPEVDAAFRERLCRGFALLDTALPELAGEIRAIVHQIVLVGSDPAAKFQFDGGSHYQLWGALFLNANFHPEEIAVAEVLAHESAHSLLFGFCTHEPLVRNDDEELFSSPLRVDKRPMDGIYHATFVSARMHWAMSQLMQSAALDEQQRERARAAAEADARNFNAGYEVVAEHAILTTLGRSLMASAKAYMDSVR